MTFPAAEAKAIWQRAIESELGVIIKTNDVRACRQILYAHKDIKNPRYQNLRIAVVEQDEVWIVRNEVTLDG